MGRPWDAEHGVDAELAARLVAAAWPDVAGPAEHVGSGWDVDVWRFGELAVRFPRRALGVRCVENELVVLRLVADRVDVPVPRPLRIAGPAFGFPARFYAHAWIPGVPVIRARLDDGALARLAAPLGTFLRALHALPLGELRAAGLRDDDRGDVARIAGRGLEWLARVAIEPALADAARALLVAPPPPTDAPPALVHADFHAGNLLVDDSLSGVIDWGDRAAGDPAIDLAIGWSLVPAAARDDFLAAYGAVTPATWARARVGAVARQGLALLAWGQGLGDPTIIEWAARSLARSLA